MTTLVRYAIGGTVAARSIRETASHILKAYRSVGALAAGEAIVCA